LKQTLNAEDAGDAEEKRVDSRFTAHDGRASDVERVEVFGIAMPMVGVKAAA
jgi:hypothetical protein